MNRKYGPDIRISENTDKKIKELNNSNNNITNPKTNDIVVNNIATNEFDYTEKPYKK